MSLVSVVYVSYESSRLSEDELVAILTASRANNQELGITGMLLYRDGFIIQVLEGEKAVVETLYEKIAVDPRHKNVIMVCEDDITSRTFEHWSMGFHVLEDHDLNHLDGYQGDLDADFFLHHPSHATQLLELFHNRTFY